MSTPTAEQQLASPPANPTHPVLPPAVQRPGHSWEPVAPCTDGCLPRPDELPRVPAALVVSRLVGLVSLILLATLVATVLPLLGARRRARVLRAIFRTVLRVIGVRLSLRGDDRFDAGPGSGGVLMVGNHLSWLDIMALGAIQPMRMVARHDTRDWPVLGLLAVRIGTLFVNRSELRTLPTLVGNVAEALRGGSVVGLFPEGTTWCGAAVGEFHRAGFQAALDAGVPVRPVAQRMCLPDGTVTTAGCFVGDETLLDSLLRVVRLPGLTIEIDVLPLLVPADGVDRRELARRAQLVIAEATGVAAPEARRVLRTASAGSELVVAAA
ncbi:lysophospholipid acyltransferase family protein [Pseudonocardia spinosispora]|uniref:lysophospholipid acyltransferase family protein n=1 Tax=Pseudonocardia spinosispora TaxID=103441 RepID=UPI000423A7C2|nr:lysophospholipid acyltransferase family protein [Pseudonocardia spinosispora]